MKKLIFCLLALCILLAPLASSSAPLAEGFLAVFDSSYDKSDYAGQDGRDAPPDAYPAPINKGIDDPQTQSPNRQDRDRPATPQTTERPTDLITPSGMEQIILPPLDPVPVDAEGMPVLETSDLIYGHEPFAIGLYQTTDGSRAPDSYVLGPGDLLRITIFGDSQIDLLLEINSEGFVRTEETPQIYLKGLNIRQARDLMRQRLSHFFSFRPEQFAMTLQTARTITVNIFGEAKNPGSYNISGLNTAFNALGAAGGPTEMGSVRNIMHIRGEKRTRLDIYQFMHDPSIQFDYDLLHNDIIYIPAAQKMIEIQGNVRRPKRYELAEGETLFELLALAGGLRPGTDLDFVQVERMEDTGRVLTEYSLRKVLNRELTINLLDGDIVRVRPVQPAHYNFVEIKGAVEYPDIYDFRQNTTLSALFDNAQLKGDAVLDIVFVERIRSDRTISIIPVRWLDLLQNEEDFNLRGEDRIMVYNERYYASIENIEVRGDVRNPFKRAIGFGTGMTVEEALAMAGGMRPTASDTAFVIRRNLMNPDFVDYFLISVSNDKDFILGPGDLLNIYSKSNYTNVPQISVNGEVNNPISLTYDPNLNITKLLRMAGGLTEKAHFSRIEVYRLNLSSQKGTEFDRIILGVDSNFVLLPDYEHFILMPYDQVIIRQHPMFDIDRSVEVRGQVFYPGQYLLESKRVTLSELIRDAGGLTDMADTRNATLIRRYNNTGPVGIDLEKTMSRSRSERYDPVIKAGDIIIIPRYINTVNIHIRGTRLGQQSDRDIISGAAFPEGSRDKVVTFVFSGPRSAKWYIENFAGGFAPNADKNSLTVTNRNGKVTGTTRSMLLFRSYPTVTPGSTISLEFKPPEPPRRSLFGRDR